MLPRLPRYSFGIRHQGLALFGGEEAEGVVVSSEHSRTFLEEIQSATFCGVFPGNGWGHIETPILHGCIPVIVQDGILLPWETALDFSSFSVRLKRVPCHADEYLARAARSVV